MKFGLPISLALHGGVLAVSVVGFGFKAKAAPEMRVIPVKIFTISDTTNVHATEKAPKPKPVETPADIAPPPPELKNEPEKAPEKTPEAAPKAEVMAETPAPQAEPETTETAQKTPDTISPPKPEKPKPLSLDDLSALVKGSKGKTDTGDQKMLESERRRIELADASRAAAGQGTGLTTAYEDAIMRRIYNAWRIPSGAPDLESLIVGVDVTLDQSGKVLTAGLSEDSARKAAGNDYYKIAAESAVRAVQDAAEFKFLPRAEYERWRNLSLTFFPKDAAESNSAGVPT